MNFELPPVGGTGHTPQAPRTRATGPSGSRFSLPDATPSARIPPSPPPEVLEQMHDAAAVADKLKAQGRELHFESVSGGGVQIQVRDLAGNVIRTMSPSEALDVAGGAPLRP